MAVTKGMVGVCLRLSSQAEREGDIVDAVGDGVEGGDAAGDEGEKKAALAF